MTLRASDTHAYPNSHSQAHRKHHTYLVGPTCCKMPGGWWAPPESWLACWAPLYWWKSQSLCHIWKEKVWACPQACCTAQLLSRSKILNYWVGVYPFRACGQGVSLRDSGSNGHFGQWPADIIILSQAKPEDQETALNGGIVSMPCKQGFLLYKTAEILFAWNFHQNHGPPAF